MGVTASSANRIAVTRSEPIGVVLALSAFNHPLNLIVHQVGPAIAAGCPVIVKPARDTALSCLRFVRILREAGLPDEWCQAVVTTGHDVAEILVTDSRLAFFSFIGSAGVGWALRSRLAPGVRCALEHGGVAPVIVAADANLDEAVPLLLKGGFYHAGQVCVSVQRIFADRRVAEELGRRLAAGADKLVVGDPRDERTEVGPLIRPKEVDRVDDWVQEAVKGGAKLLGGGKRLDHNCYAPTVLYETPEDATISKKEVFGPVVSIYPYTDVADAIAQANGLEYAFQAAVFTREIDFAMRCFRELDGSAIMVNDHTAFRVDWMPFAGLRQSGFGVGGIGHTFHDMQIEKMLVIRSPQLP
jgi:acyl-CoA reductase-like NAD-dependent aldehyde dehydrogenase